MCLTKTQSEQPAVESFKKFYNGNGMPLYASKALSCKELCRIANEEHLGLDVVSGGEIYTAQQAGFPMEKTHFHGNNKTAAEIPRYSHASFKIS